MIAEAQGGEFISDHIGDALDDRAVIELAADLHVAEVARHCHDPLGTLLVCFELQRIEIIIIFCRFHRKICDFHVTFNGVDLASLKVRRGIEGERSVRPLA